MRYIDLFVRDHPDMDVEKAVAVNCPQDFWEDADCSPEYCMDGIGVGAYEACRRCWAREAVKK